MTLSATPSVSYTIWFSQRTASTLLTTALEATGVAGCPHEWFHASGVGRWLEAYDVEDVPALQQALWARGATPNGVWGAKVSFHEPKMTGLFDLFRQLPDCPAVAPRPTIWEHAFPNHRHIFMMRRNKVRQAVSWWRAIQSQEWQRPAGQAAAPPPDIDADYNYDAIRQLLTEAALREAGIAAFLAEGRITPLTLVYEDFILDYEGTLRRVLAYLGLDADAVSIPPHPLERLSDTVAEVWVQRFRAELQTDWTYRGW